MNSFQLGAYLSPGDLFLQPVTALSPSLPLLLI